jgi:predicted house-cleaning noncanonical NTP pyrophosphatase (MazG superfamily)
LVRDRILEIIENDGKRSTQEILCEEDYSKELCKKLLEETKEYIDTNNVEELADILEVLYSIIENKNLTINDIEKIRIEKNIERGGFKKRIFLKEVIG